MRWASERTPFGRTIPRPRGRHLETGKGGDARVAGGESAPSREAPVGQSGDREGAAPLALRADQGAAGGGRSCSFTGFSLLEMESRTGRAAGAGGAAGLGDTSTFGAGAVITMFPLAPARR